MRDYNDRDKIQPGKKKNQTQQDTHDDPQSEKSSLPKTLIPETGIPIIDRAANYIRYSLLERFGLNPDVQRQIDAMIPQAVVENLAEREAFLEEAQTYKSPYAQQNAEALQEYRDSNTAPINVMTRYGTVPGHDWWHAKLEPLVEIIEAANPKAVPYMLGYLAHKHPDVFRLLTARTGVREHQGLERWGDPKLDPTSVNRAFNAVYAALIAEKFHEAVRLLSNMPDEVRRLVLNRILEMRPKDSLLSSMTAIQLDQVIKNPQSKPPAHLLQNQSVGPGPWNPPGNQPVPYYIGDQAHRQIADFYRNANFGDQIFTNTTPITTILDRLKKGDSKPELSAEQLLMRPDILNSTKEHLYEIKPEGSQALALTEATLYVTALNQAGVSVTYGPSGVPGTEGAIEAPGGYFLFWSPVPGVILYRYRRGSSEDPAPVTVPQPIIQEKDELIKKLETATGLTGAALVLYLIISEGSRIFPPRNLLPIP
jgi:hypothetical protein